jgi:hypothetical protein
VGVVEGRVSYDADEDSVRPRISRLLCCALLLPVPRPLHPTEKLPYDLQSVPSRTISTHHTNTDCCHCIAFGGRAFVLPYANMHAPYYEPQLYNGQYYCLGESTSNNILRSKTNTQHLANVIGTNTPANSNGFLLLGDAFMIAMYSEFDQDNNRVGFGYGI